MKYSKFIISAMILSSALLVGCSKHKAPTVKGQQVGQIHSDVQAARDEAARANQRLDNIARGYKK